MRKLQAKQQAGIDSRHMFSPEWEEDINLAEREFFRIAKEQENELLDSTVASLKEWFMEEQEERLYLETLAFEAQARASRRAMEYGIPLENTPEEFRSWSVDEFRTWLLDCGYAEEAERISEIVDIAAKEKAQRENDQLNLDIH